MFISEVTLYTLWILVVLPTSEPNSQSNVIIIQVVSVSSIRMYHFTPEMKVAHL